MELKSLKSTLASASKFSKAAFLSDFLLDPAPHNIYTVNTEGEEQFTSSNNSVY